MLLYVMSSDALCIAHNRVHADKYNNLLRRVTQAGVVTTVAGSFGNSGSSDGAALLATFSFPTTITFDAR